MEFDLASSKLVKATRQKFESGIECLILFHPNSIEVKRRK